MNLSPDWVSFLAKAGFDAIHWSQVGRANAPDGELFEWARDKGCVIFTHDLDFGAMLALTRAESPSVFQIRTEDVSPTSLASRAIVLLKRFQTELKQGALVVVDELHERVRVLPLAGARA